ncbi:uncharacterized protein LOC127841208 isoform X2 [Dreissena polymorpha]|nr:uncharacterized protein LOC127841208 isoform X2 [Dreissena polymorpha]
MQSTIPTADAETSSILKPHSNNNKEMESDIPGKKVKRKSSDSNVLEKADTETSNIVYAHRNNTTEMKTDILGTKVKRKSSDLIESENVIEKEMTAVKKKRQDDVSKPTSSSSNCETDCIIRTDNYTAKSSCFICGKLFTSLGGLNSHYAIHFKALSDPKNNLDQLGAVVRTEDSNEADPNCSPAMQTLTKMNNAFEDMNTLSRKETNGNCFLSKKKDTCCTEKSTNHSSISCKEQNSTVSKQPRPVAFILKGSCKNKYNIGSEQYLEMKPSHDVYKEALTGNRIGNIDTCIKSMEAADQIQKCVKENNDSISPHVSNKPKETNCKFNQSNDCCEFNITTINGTNDRTSPLRYENTFISTGFDTLSVCEYLENKDSLMENTNQSTEFTVSMTKDDIGCETSHQLEDEQNNNLRETKPNEFGMILNNVCLESLGKLVRDEILSDQEYTALDKENTRENNDIDTEVEKQIESCNSNLSTVSIKSNVNMFLTSRSTINCRSSDEKYVEDKAKETYLIRPNNLKEKTKYIEDVKFDKLLNNQDDQTKNNTKIVLNKIDTIEVEDDNILAEIKDKVSLNKAKGESSRSESKYYFPSNNMSSESITIFDSETGNENSNTEQKETIETSYAACNQTQCLAKPLDEKVKCGSDVATLTYSLRPRREKAKFVENQTVTPIKIIKKQKVARVKISQKKNKTCSKNYHEICYKFSSDDNKCETFGNSLRGLSHDEEVKHEASNVMNLVTYCDNYKKQTTMSHVEKTLDFLRQSGFHVQYKHQFDQQTSSSEFSSFHNARLDPISKCLAYVSKIPPMMISDLEMKDGTALDSDMESVGSSTFFNDADLCNTFDKVEDSDSHKLQLKCAFIKHDSDLIKCQIGSSGEVDNNKFQKPVEQASEMHVDGVKIDQVSSKQCDELFGKCESESDSGIGSGVLKNIQYAEVINQDSKSSLKQCKLCKKWFRSLPALHEHTDKMHKSYFVPDSAQICHTILSHIIAPNELTNTVKVNEDNACKQKETDCAQCTVIWSAISEHQSNLNDEVLQQSNLDDEVQSNIDYCDYCDTFSDNKYSEMMKVIPNLKTKNIIVKVQKLPISSFKTADGKLAKFIGTKSYPVWVLESGGGNQESTLNKSKAGRLKYKIRDACKHDDPRPQRYEIIPTPSKKDKEHLKKLFRALDDKNNISMIKSDLVDMNGTETVCDIVHESSVNTSADTADAETEMNKLSNAITNHVQQEQDKVTSNTVQSNVVSNNIIAYRTNDVISENGRCNETSKARSQTENKVQNTGNEGFKLSNSNKEFSSTFTVSEIIQENNTEPDLNKNGVNNSYEDDDDCTKNDIVLNSEEGVASMNVDDDKCDFPQTEKSDIDLSVTFGIHDSIITEHEKTLEIEDRMIIETSVGLHIDEFEAEISDTKMESDGTSEIINNCKFTDLCQTYTSKDECTGVKEFLHERENRYSRLNTWAKMEAILQIGTKHVIERDQEVEYENLPTTIRLEQKEAQNAVAYQITDFEKAIDYSPESNTKSKTKGCSKHKVEALKENKTRSVENKSRLPVRQQKTKSSDIYILPQLTGGLGQENQWNLSHIKQCRVSKSKLAQNILKKHQLEQEVFNKKEMEDTLEDFESSLISRENIPPFMRDDKLICVLEHDVGSSVKFTSGQEFDEDFVKSSQKQSLKKLKESLELMGIIKDKTKEDVTRLSPSASKKQLQFSTTGPNNSSLKLILPSFSSVFGLLNNTMKSIHDQTEPSLGHSLTENHSQETDTSLEDAEFELRHSLSGSHWHGKSRLSVFQRLGKPKEFHSNNDKDSQGHCNDDNNNEVSFDTNKSSLFSENATKEEETLTANQSKVEKNHPKDTGKESNVYSCNDNQIEIADKTEEKHVEDKNNNPKSEFKINDSDYQSLDTTGEKGSIKWNNSLECQVSVNESDTKIIDTMQEKGDMPVNNFPYCFDDIDELSFEMEGKTEQVQDDFDSGSEIGIEQIQDDFDSGREAGVDDNLEQSVKEAGLTDLDFDAGSESGVGTLNKKISATADLVEEMEDVLEIYASDDDASFLDEPLYEENSISTKQDSVVKKKCTAMETGTDSLLKEEKHPAQPVATSSKHLTRFDQSEMTQVLQGTSSLDPTETRKQDGIHSFNVNNASGIQSRVFSNASGQDRPGLRQFSSFMLPALHNHRWVPHGWCFKRFNQQPCMSQPCLFRHDEPSTSDLLTEANVKRLRNACMTGDIEKALIMLKSHNVYQDCIEAEELVALFQWCCHRNQLEACHTLLSLMMGKNCVTQELLDSAVSRCGQLQPTLDSGQLMWEVFLVSKQLNIQLATLSLKLMLRTFSNLMMGHCFWQVVYHCKVELKIDLPMSIVQSALAIVVENQPNETLAYEAYNFIKTLASDAIQGLDNLLLQRLTTVFHANGLKVHDLHCTRAKKAQRSANVGESNSCLIDFTVSRELESGTPAIQERPIRAGAPVVVANGVGHAQSDLRDVIANAERSAVIARIIAAGLTCNIKELAQIFVDQTARGVLLDGAARRAFEKALCQHGPVGAMWDAFHQHLHTHVLQKLQITPTYQPDHAALRKIGVSLFHHAYNAGDFPEALTVLGVSKARGCLSVGNPAGNPGTVALQAAITCCLNTGQAKEAAQIIIETAICDFPCETKVEVIALFGPLVDQLIEQGGLTEAFQILKTAFSLIFQYGRAQLTVEEFEPHSVASNMMLVCLDQEQLDICILVHQMYRDHRVTFSIDDDVKRSFMNALASQRKLEYAEEIRSEFKDTVLFPTQSLAVNQCDGSGRCIRLHDSMTKMEGLLVVRDYLRDLYQSLSVKVRHSGPLSAGELKLKIVFDRKSRLYPGRKKLPYMDRSLSLLRDIQQGLLLPRFMSPPLGTQQHGDQLMVEPASLERYLTSLGHSGVKPSLIFLDGNQTRKSVTKETGPGSRKLKIQKLKI